jgi:hypothetical protein
METEKEKTNEWKNREVGALWKKAGKTQNYFSGKINIEKYKEDDSINVVGFSNTNKKDNANAPDVILYYSAPMSASSLDLDEGTQASAKVVKTEPSSKSSSESSFEDESPDF